jgi:N-hydroxyarylamine O-acetyltransferase
MDDKLLSEYLVRIGAARPGSPDAAALRSLHRAHLLTVPFENLSIHLPEPISLTEDDLIGKIVVRRRGGFCYELNGAFRVLLHALDSSPPGGRPRSAWQARAVRSHLALVVHPADGSGPWLADVGFGSHSTFPLLLGKDQEQDDPAGRFSLAQMPDGDIDVLKDGEPQYRIEPRERQLEDFEPTCWWQQTSPRSHFTQGLICSLLTDDGGRVSLSGRTLIRTAGGSRTENELPTDEAVLAAYRDYFGITLDRVPRVTSLAR